VLLIAFFIDGQPIECHNGAQLRQLMREVDKDGDGELSLEDISTMMEQQTFNKADKGRYFAAVSLEEAECLRGILHAFQDKPFVSGSRSSMALHYGEHSMEASFGFSRGPELQRRTAVQSFRFIDSQLHYSRAEVSVLCRALQPNPVAERITFFNEVRSCRRRAQQPWEKLSIAPILKTSDQFQLLELHAILSAIRLRIVSKGMKSFDAFRAFDYDRDGMLSCSELFGGLLWLGMCVVEADIYAIMKHIDSKGDGRIRFADFQATLSTSGDGDEAQEDEIDVTADQSSGDVSNAEFRRIAIKPKMMKELYDEDDHAGSSCVGARSSAQLIFCLIIYWPYASLG
jgi:Ca2+-binding EF-hand superfamily protein